MRKLSLLLLFAFCCINIYSQGQAAHWYFGYNSGFDFTNRYTANNAVINGVTGQTVNNIPQFVTGPISTYEGCFTISDKSGNLLFSSDGITVYNKLNQAMPNGQDLKGRSSAAQSGIVIPRPGHPDNYYIVTTSASEQTPHRGMHYYEIDMTLDGGKGDVIPNSETQIQFVNQAGTTIYSALQAYENIAAVGHANGIDYWLVHRIRRYFFVWKVTREGIADKADIYDIGIDPPVHVYPGYTKFSGDGKYIANAYSNTSTFTIGKFDNATGAITNIKTRGSLGYSNAYTMEFSPNNKYLYFTFYYTGPVMRLSVNSLLNGTAETPQLVMNSVTNIQMGPDGRIYGIASKDRSSSVYRNLYMILDPDQDNIADIKCTYIPNYFPAANGSHLSLTNFTSSFFGMDEIKVEPKDKCINQNLTFSVQINTGTGSNSVNKIVWDFGDGTPIVTDSNMDKYYFTQTHAYAKRGIYNITLTPYRSDGTAITDKTQTIQIKVGSCTLPVNHNISNMEYK